MRAALLTAILTAALTGCTHPVLELLLDGPVEPTPIVNPYSADQLDPRSSRYCAYCVWHIGQVERAERRKSLQKHVY